jgi:hypothetical protein
MKLSDSLNLVSSILTLAFILFLIRRNMISGCFNWLDYGVSFATLFTNLGINILTALGR